MDIHASVVGGFERFTTCWQFEDFWTRGNTYDAMLRFVDAATQKWPNDPTIKKMSAVRAQIIQANTDYFTSNTNGWWADDYGWWGLACLTARSYLLRIGDKIGGANYLGYAAICWKKMLAGGYDTLDTAKPVPHGCANSSSPSDDGTKNTVTNANLFLLSLRLYAAVKATDPVGAAGYLKIASAQYLWFTRWFAPAYGYLRTFPGPFGLAQERPMAPPSYVQKDRPTWERGWTWTGDQGLLLATMAEAYLVREDLSVAISGNVSADSLAADILNAFTTIATGVRQLLFGVDDKMLREAPFNSSFADDPKDYVCGRGVLSRYLAEPSVRQIMKSPFYPEGIFATAQAVWASRNTTSNQFAAGWTPGNDAAFNAAFKAVWGDGDIDVEWPDTMFDGIKQATGLDVLTAALIIGV